MKIKSLIIKDGYIYIAALAVLSGLTAILLSPYWSIFPGVFTLFMVFFFRNPRRCIDSNDRNILSPADGKVMSIADKFEEKFLNGEGTKITIFLSVLDVHVNRSPIAGEIKYQEYCCGRFRPAYKDSVGWENERHTIGMESANMRILVTQIAGVLARRIVSWVTLGSLLAQGQLYGMIKFGSCTEIIVPKGVEILVKKGDHVKGGVTVLGKLPD